MSGYGHGECHICTAQDDYCTLQCADGQEIDCRMLRLDEGVQKMPRPDWIEPTEGARDTSPQDHCTVHGEDWPCRGGFSCTRIEPGGDSRRVCPRCGPTRDESSHRADRLEEELAEKLDEWKATGQPPLKVIPPEEGRHPGIYIAVKEIAAMPSSYPSEAADKITAALLLVARAIDGGHNNGNQ